MQVSKAFPFRIKDDVQLVMNVISNTVSSPISITFTDFMSTICKLENEQIEIPNRMYYEELPCKVYTDFTESQLKILYCLYTRHHSGYVRQKYLEKLFDMTIEEWEIPFIIKLCDEYVIEILVLIYDKLSNRTNDDIKEFCLNNKDMIHKGYERMMSYWNVYYRRDYFDFYNYIGRKLFREYFGFDKSFKMDIVS
jgi:hypothetical protein